MFNSFDPPSSKESRRRYALSTGASMFVYGLVGALVLLLAKKEAPAVKEKMMDVVFRAPEVQPAPRPVAPPPAVPKDVKVKRTQAVAPPRPVVVPDKLPTQKQAEADPAKDEVEVAEGGTGEGGGGTGGQAVAPPPPPPPPPAPKPRRSEPINLPENAVAPVAEEGNAQPEFPEAARAQGLEGQVILKIVVSESGAVTQIQVLRGEEPFVSAATAAVRTWRYRPALVDGQPTAVFRIVKIPFRLRS